MEPTYPPILDFFIPVTVSQVSENTQNIQAPEMSVNVDDSAFNPNMESFIPSVDN